MHRTTKALLFMMLFNAGFSDAQTPTDPVLRGIHIRGNQRTKDQVIFDQVPLKPGESLSRSTWGEFSSRVQANLVNLNIFNEVRIAFRMDTSTITGSFFHLDIELLEKWYVWPIPFLEFADRNINQWSEFSFDPARTNYGLYVFQYNIGGWNHTLKWSLIHGYSKLQGLEYQSARLGNKRRLSLSAKARHQSNSEVWISTRDNRLQFYRSGTYKAHEQSILQSSVTWHFSPVRSMQMVCQYKNISLGDSLLPEMNPHYLGEGSMQAKKIEWELNYRKEGRDNRFLPLQGTLIELRAGLAQFSRMQGSSQPIATVSMRAGYWQRTARRLAGYSTIRAVYKWSDSPLPYAEARALGYEDYIRGFEHRVVDGHAYGYFRHGLRYLLLDRSIPIDKMPLAGYRKMDTKLMGGLFLDHGVAFDGMISADGVSRTGNELAGRYLFAAGIALEGSIYYDKVIRFEISQNSIGNWGISFYFRQAI